MDMERRVDQEVLRHAVAKKIQCDKSGEVLDVRSAMMAEIQYTSGRTSYVVVKAEFWPGVEATIPDILAHPLVASIKVYNGPELFGRKKVTK